MAVTPGGKFYLSSSDGCIEVWSESGGGFVREKRIKALSRAGMAASNGAGLAAFADNTGRAVLLDTAADKIYAKFNTFTSSDSLSLDAEGNVCSVKRGNEIRFFDYGRLPVYALSKAALPYAIALSVLTAAVFAVTVLLRFRAGGKKVKEIATKLYESKKSYLFLLLTFGLLAVFSYYPIIWGMRLGFYDYMPGIRSDFVGFANFVSVFNNPMFWQGVGNMALFLVTDIIKAFVPPFIVAQVILAIRNKRVQYCSRFVMFLPGVLPGIAAVLLWTTGILGPGGILNQILQLLGIQKDASWAWLGHSSTAKWALILMGFPFVGSYLIYYGALRNISQSYYDAAKMDGCGWLKCIAMIDIPMISPQLKYIFIVSFIGSVQDFGRVFLTTRGAYDTNIPALELYLNVSQYQNFGVAAAMGLIMFVAIFGATLLNLRIKTQSED
jgi:ABC-type sugar transport system permease subunit